MTAYTVASTVNPCKITFYFPIHTAMKNALQEQLLKAGLATEKQINKANAAKKKGKKQAPRKPKNQRKQEQSDLAAAYSARKKAEAAEHAEKQRLAALKKANKATIDALIRDNTLNKDKAELPYQFLVGTTIKKVYVTEEQKAKLLNGEIGIVFRKGQRCIIPKTIVDKILQLDPQKVVFINEPLETSAEEGDYAGFDVPDDLDW
ncbi:MAG: DUF2058 domain-containing protein [bacterium]